MDDLSLEYMCEFATPCAFIFACGCAFAYVFAFNFEAILKKNCVIFVLECLFVTLFLW
jgi:hypothetical protein